MPSADEIAAWLRELLTMALARHASEIRIQAGQPPALRIAGTFYDVAAEPLSAEHVAAVMASLNGGAADSLTSTGSGGTTLVVAGVGAFSATPLFGGMLGMRLEPLQPQQQDQHPLPRSQPPFLPDRAPAPASAQSPPQAAEPVDFRAFAPPAIAPGSAGLVDVWACLPSQAAEVARRAAAGAQSVAEGLTSGVPLARGTRVGVRLAVDGLRVKPALQTLAWRGEPANVSFIVAAPDGAREGRHAARARLFVEGLPIGELHFLLTVGAAARAPALADADAVRTRWKSAFASYASEDRAEVYARVQGMKAVAPELDIFVDVLGLRAGERWKPGIEREISLRERVFLFWSRHARESQWVDFEWRLAQRLKGIDAIDPVPLDDPREAPPPPELAALHFNDAYLSLIAAERARQTAAP